MAEIAADVGAILFIDMAHVAGLVAADVHPSPFPHADLVTTTTHKTLRGPRGGMIFGASTRCVRGLDAADFPAVKNGGNEGALGASIDRNVFPGIQGGPLMHVIAGKAVAFKLAAEEPFRERPAADDRERRGHGRDPRRPRRPGRVRRHRQPPDARRRHAARGHRQGGGAPARRDRDHRQQERDPVRHAAPEHGLRASGSGTPATTSRGFGPDEMRAVGRIIIEAIRRRDEPAANARLAGEVREIVSRFPVPGLPAA